MKPATTSLRRRCRPVPPNSRVQAARARVCTVGEALPASRCRADTSPWPAAAGPGSDRRLPEHEPPRCWVASELIQARMVSVEISSAARHGTSQSTDGRESSAPSTELVLSLARSVATSSFSRHHHSVSVCRYGSGHRPERRHRGHQSSGSGFPEIVSRLPWRDFRSPACAGMCFTGLTVPRRRSDDRPAVHGGAAGGATPAPRARGRSARTADSTPAAPRSGGRACTADGW